MKLLAINLPNLDLSYFSKRGLEFEVEYKTINEIFPLKYLYEQMQYGRLVSMYTPNPETYLNINYPYYEQAIILVGYNPKDYSSLISNTGGYTCPTLLSSGAVWLTVRKDGNENAYALHELHHALCAIINLKLGDRSQKDFMDNTPVGNTWIPYYLNNQPDNPQSNFAQTWAKIAPFIPQLENIQYAPKNTGNSLTATLKRNYEWNVETVGELKAINGLKEFNCRTLELPFKGNSVNISSIPKGTYQCEYTFSWKFMKSTYEIKNVPNRSGIRIHSGNYFFNVSGCILLGDSYGDLNIDGIPDILNSAVTVKKFEDFFDRKPFTLNVV